MVTRRMFLGDTLAVLALAATAKRMASAGASIPGVLRAKRSPAQKESPPPKRSTMSWIS